ncbi:unnamed protein product [Symbiodinium pilosum]|uniref:Uncharacterized protein n=1 Tax=Symbiodinium pilosum TaxID=2952 RepID=A0A812UZE3_SYMPI|nr:unnamed protein product [Symbiodinium pilosum]
MTPPPIPILLFSLLAFWLMYYADVVLVRDRLGSLRSWQEFAAATLWCTVQNLLAVVAPWTFARHSGATLQDLGLRMPDLADPCYQLLLSWLFAAQLLKAFPDLKTGKDFLRDGGICTQIAWNASTLWKWFFAYCWVQQSARQLGGPIAALLMSTSFFTLFHVGTQDVAYLKRAWLVNAFFAVPFLFFGFCVIWPLAVGTGGAVGTTKSNRFFRWIHVRAQLAGFLLAVALGYAAELHLG